VIEVGERRRRIEHQSGLAAVLADQRQRPVDVFGGFGMKADDVGASTGKIGNDAIKGRA
jgi:hypothetical protein